MSDLPAGPFSAIACDPPWHFSTYDGKRSVAARTAEDPYPTMTLDDLKALPVASVAAKDCALFMWIVDAHLVEALALGKAWGFAFKTIAFIWDKGEIGMGYWTRKEAEFCLLFTRGSPKRLHKDVRQIIRAPRREHSRKPWQTHQRIMRLVGGPYLEMFSREEHNGWTSWGLERGKFDEN